LPDVITFEQFETAFERGYRTVEEELIRMRLFLMRLVRAFVLSIVYKYRSLSYYYAINDCSDWTLREIKASRNRHPVSADVLAGGQSTRGTVLFDGRIETVSPELDGETTLESEEGQQQRSDVITEWPGNEEKTQQWVPSCKMMNLTNVNIDAQERSYKHLPVKSNYRMSTTGGAHQDHRQSAPVALIEEHWGDLWYGKMADSRKEQDDVVWVDHRRLGCMQPVQSQSHCGSCYVFSSLAVLEWAIGIETGMRIKSSSMCCSGGTEVYVGEFILNFSLELAADYPYRAEPGSCPYEQITPPTVY